MNIKRAAVPSYLDLVNDNKVPDVWGNGAYEFDKNTQQMKFTPAGGTKTYTYDPLNVAEWRNAGRLMRNNSWGDIRFMNTNELNNQYVGDPNFSQMRNNYWASIPDEDWNKMYDPATPDVRRNYSGGRPYRAHQDYPGAPNMPDGGYYQGLRWYNKKNAADPTGGAIRAKAGLGATPINMVNAELGQDGYKSWWWRLLAPTKFSGGISSNSYPYLAMGSRVKYSELPAYMHELNHVSQVNRLPKNLVDQSIGVYLAKQRQHGRSSQWLAMTGQRLAGQKQDESRFPQLHAGYAKEDPRARVAYDPYTVKPVEASQARSTLNRSVYMAQRLMQEHPGRFAQFDQNDIKAFQGFKAYGDKQNFIDRNTWLVKHPEFAHLLGGEGTRAVASYSELLRAMQERPHAQYGMAQPIKLDLKDNHDRRRYQQALQRFNEYNNGYFE